MSFDLVNCVTRRCSFEQSISFSFFCMCIWVFQNAGVGSFMICTQQFGLEKLGDILLAYVTVFLCCSFEVYSVEICSLFSSGCYFNPQKS